MSNKFILSIGKGLCCTTFWNQGDNTPPSQLEGQRKKSFATVFCIVNFRLHISPQRPADITLKSSVLTAVLFWIDFNWKHVEEIRSSLNSQEKKKTSTGCHKNYQENELKIHFIWKLNVFRNTIKGFLYFSKSLLQHSSTGPYFMNLNKTLRTLFWRFTDFTMYLRLHHKLEGLNRV